MVRIFTHLVQQRAWRSLCTCPRHSNPRTASTFSWRTHPVKAKAAPPHVEGAAFWVFNPILNQRHLTTVILYKKRLIIASVFMLFIHNRKSLFLCSRFCAFSCSFYAISRNTNLNQQHRLTGLAGHVVDLFNHFSPFVYILEKSKVLLGFWVRFSNRR